MFGEVRKATTLATATAVGLSAGMEVAVKRFRHNHKDNLALVALTRKVRACHHILRITLQSIAPGVGMQAQGHRNVMPLLDSWSEGDALVVVTPLARCSVERLIEEETAAQRWSIAAAIRVVTDIAAGLARVHAVDAALADIKPTDVLIMPDGTAVLSDLRPHHCIIMPDEYAELADGSVIHIHSRLAPEALAVDDYMGWQSRPTAEHQRANIWALGLLAYQLVCADLRDLPLTEPAGGLRGFMAFVLWMRGRPAADWSRLPAATPPALRALLAVMMSTDPAARPTAARAHAELQKLSATIVGPPGDDGLPVPRYRLDGELGAGAFGVAHRATVLSHVPSLGLREGALVVVKITRDNATVKSCEEAELLRRVRGG
jgi:serine/threonine protein kinase